MEEKSTYFLFSQRKSIQIIDNQKLITKPHFLKHNKTVHLSWAKMYRFMYFLFS